MVIKLKNTIANKNMLMFLTHYIGGRVREVKSNIIWVEDNQKEIERKLLILKEFPPLTKRLNSQITFLVKCMESSSVEWYFQERNNKYLLDKIQTSFLYPSYYNHWLSGFIEAEGSFSIRPCFSIGQKNEKSLITNIRNYFQSSNKIMEIKDFYMVNIYKKETLLKIVQHCINFPLIGEKKESLKKFMEILV